MRIIRSSFVFVCSVRSRKHWVATMPILKNIRHERFAQLLASGKTATDAHEAG
jgi:hypothetical protein